MSTLEFHLEVEIEPKGATLAQVAQVHGSNCVHVPDVHLWGVNAPQADAVWTEKLLERVYVFTADCLPVVIAQCAEASPRIAAIHAGWRGALAGLVEKVEAFIEQGLGPTKVAFGPSIGPCCFEVREDFIAAFETANKPVLPFLESRNGRNYFSLPDYVQQFALKGKAIDRSQWRCTVCSSPALPSYRRNRGTDPRIRTTGYLSQVIK